MSFQTGSKGLFFSRLDKLDDPFEGSLPKHNARKDLISTPAGWAKGSQAAEVHRNLMKLQIRPLVKNLRAWVYVNCWHMSGYESAAMWRLYAHAQASVCIRSTYAKLRTLLPRGVFLGQVNYIDYEKHAIPFGEEHWSFIYKRKSFEHERELRAVIVDMASVFTSPPPKPPPDGILRPIKLATLIDRVYIGPTAPAWLVRTVKVTLKQFGFAIPVKRSILDESPMW